MNIKFSLTELILQFEKYYYYFNFFMKYFIKNNILGDQKYLYDGRWLICKFIFIFDNTLIKNITNNYIKLNYKYNYLSNQIDLLPKISNYEYLNLIDHQKKLSEKLFNYIYQYDTKAINRLKLVLFDFIKKINFLIENINALLYFNDLNFPICDYITNNKKKYIYYDKNEFIPVIGGLFKNNYIKSFYLTKDLIKVGQYVNFIINDGYNNKKYWSEIGWNWKNKNNINFPYKWVMTDDKNIYINNKNINFCLNLPIINISFWEAQAFAKWKGGYLPNKYEWLWVATNRNKTHHPHGIEKPNSFQYNIDLTMKQPIINLSINKSILGFNDLYGNAWEWCDSSYKNNNNKIIKGGSWITFKNIMNTDLEWEINQNCRYYPIGFRVLKYKN